MSITMKRFIPLTLLMPLFSSLAFASYPMGEDDDEGAAIAQALRDADEEESLKANLAAALPEMRRARSTYASPVNAPASQEQLSQDEALAIALAMEESKARDSRRASMVAPIPQEAVIPEMRRPHSAPQGMPVQTPLQNNQTLNDEAIARALFENEQKTHKTQSSKAQEQMARDEELAKLLDQENDAFRPKPRPQPGDAFYIPETERQQLQGMAQTYVQLTAANPREGMNVHSFNKTFVVPNRQAILAINQRLKLKEDTSLDALISEVQKHNVKTPHLEQALGKLKNYIAHHRIDSETGLNITQMISWTYELAKNVHRYSNNSLFCMPAGDHVSALDYVARSLDENINEQGGCLPGFMGRMFDVNFHFLCELAGVKIA